GGAARPPGDPRSPAGGGLRGSPARRGSTQVGCRRWADRSAVACAGHGRNLMEDHVYRLSEVVGTSSEGIDQAIRNAVARANRTLRNLDWFQVSEIRGVTSGGEGARGQGTRDPQARVPPGGVTARPRLDPGSGSG